MSVIDPDDVPYVRGTYSRVLLASYYGCTCDPKWLTGAYAKTMAKMLVKEANRHGLGVVGKPTIDYFGETRRERRTSGMTINITLHASGVSFDFWPEGVLTKGDQEYLGTVQKNLHYCNREIVYDDQARAFDDAVGNLLCAMHIDRFDPVDMPIDKEMP